MQEKKHHSVWLLVLYTCTVIIALVGIALALGERRYLQAGLFGALAAFTIAQAIEYRRRARQS